MIRSRKRHVRQHLERQIGEVGCRKLDSYDMPCPILIQTIRSMSYIQLCILCSNFSQAMPDWFSLKRLLLMTNKHATRNSESCGNLSESEALGCLPACHFFPTIPPNMSGKSAQALFHGAPSSICHMQEIRMLQHMWSLRNV